MKTVFICAGCAFAAFLFMGFQMGLFAVSAGDDDPEPEFRVEVKKEEQKPASLQVPFPEGLIPASRFRPVPEAGTYDPAPRPHPLVFFRVDGKLHKAWQDMVEPEWAPETVKQTELVVVVSPDHKTQLSITTYPNGAPPVIRFRYDLQVNVVEARTGKLLVHQKFFSIPRAVRKVEDWGLTALGQPVSFSTVSQWVKAQSQKGFPVGK